MMLRLAFVALLFVHSLACVAQFDFRDRVIPLYQGKESTALSIYDANPESPDGKHICFIKYPEIVTGGHHAPRKMVDVMIKNRQSGVTRKIYNSWTTNHNGSNAVWVNDSLVAFQVSHLGDFILYNILSNQSPFGLVSGELGHKSFNNVLMYSLCSTRALEIDKLRSPYDPALEGIYSLNGLSGGKKLIVKKQDIVKAFRSQNPAVYSDTAMILHVEPNSDNSGIMFDFRCPVLNKKRWESYHGYVNADGSGIRWVKERPMHVVWYDNTSMAGVDTKDPQYGVYRYDLEGNKLELLAGPSCHPGISPDRKWYVGERGYYRAMPDGYNRVYLYKQGEPMPYALLAEWKNSKVTWGWVAHVNPSFSAEGERIYFIRAVDHADKFEAVYLEMKGLLK